MRTKRRITVKAAVQAELDDALCHIEQCRSAVRRLVLIGVLQPQSNTDMAQLVEYLKFARANTEDSHAQGVAR